MNAEKITVEFLPNEKGHSNMCKSSLISNFLILLIATSLISWCSDENTSEETPVKQSIEETTPYWTQIECSSRPERRASMMMAYDSKRNKLVLFGGEISYPSWDYFGDTWEFDGEEWQKIETEHAPQKRSRGGFCYSKTLEKCILFGGYGENGKHYNDTWTYDGQDWVKRDTATSPPARKEFAMVFDGNINRVLIFGGEKQNDNILNDFWSFDGITWTLIDLEIHPTHRVQAKMVYDSNRKKTVLFGGNYGMTFFNDTWEYDGVKWDKIETIHKVSPKRNFFGLCYDTFQRKCLLFGGSNIFSLPSKFNDIWEYNGSDWFKLDISDSPSPRWGVEFEYFNKDYKTILFGGFDSQTRNIDDTWAYSTVILH